MLLLFLTFILSASEPSAPLLQIRGNSQVSTVQFVITMGDKTADETWRHFLEHWQSTFDSDHDGGLSLDEAAIVPPLANAANSLIRVEMQTADANGDGRVSGEELHHFYRHRGVSGVSTVPPTVDHAAIQIGEALWGLLDYDHDGKLSSNELADAPKLLNRWDRDEDECLTPLELRRTEESQKQSRELEVDWSPGTIESGQTVTVSLQLNSLNGDQIVKPTAEKTLPAGLESIDRGRLRLRLTSTTVVIQLADASIQRILAAKQYLLGEVATARGDAVAIAPVRLRSDPALDWLLPLMIAADADRNGLLDESEIRKVINLLTEGAAAQVTLVVSIRGRNLFDALDTNADDQLDLRELVAAKHLLEGQAANASTGPENLLSPDQIPLNLVVDVRRGPINGRFGRLRVSRRPTEIAASQKPAMVLPRWFTAMDRNHDQMISASEFLGQPERFQLLDRNHDGVITSDEIIIDSGDGPK